LITGWSWVRIPAGPPFPPSRRAFTLGLSSPPMPRATSLHALYEGWADQHRRLLDTLRPLSPAQMRLRPAPSEWAIWQLASNMAGGRLYWLCHMLGEDDRGLTGMFK